MSKTVKIKEIVNTENVTFYFENIGHKYDWTSYIKEKNTDVWRNEHPSIDTMFPKILTDKDMLKIKTSARIEYFNKKG